MNRLAKTGRAWAWLACFSWVACSDSTAPGPPEPLEDGGLVVSGAEPAILPRGATVELKVFGSGFDQDSRVVLTLHGAPTAKVQTAATRFVSPRELDATITTAADAPGGPYDIMVEGRNGKQGVGTELVDMKAHVFGINEETVHPGGSVIISGINFGTDRARVIVTFGSLGAFVSSVSNTNIVAVVPLTLSSELPSGTTTVRVKIAGTLVLAEIEAVIGAPLSPLFPLPSLPQIASLTPSEAGPGEEVSISGSGFAPWNCCVRVFFSGEPGNELPATILEVFENEVIVVVPWELPAGTASVRAAFADDMVFVGDLGVVRTGSVANVAGQYLTGDYVFSVVAQTAETVTVDLSRGGAVVGTYEDPGFPDWIFTGTLAPDGQFRATSTTVGCTRRTLILTFSAGDFSGSMDCEDAGVLNHYTVHGRRHRL